MNKGLDKVDMLKIYEERAVELDELKRRIDQCKSIQEMQMMQIPFVNGDSGMYMIGLYNGMEMMLATMCDRRPEFAGMPMEAVEGDIPDDTEEGEQVVSRTIAGLVKAGIEPCRGTYEGGDGNV